MKRRKLLLGLLAAKVAYAGSVDHSYDVIVVGSGAAGLSAAAENGARRVLVLEKETTLGGHTMVSTGYVSALSRKNVSQKDYEASAHTMLEGMRRLADGRGNEALQRKLVYESADIIEWLASMGLRWEDNVFQTLAGLAPRSYISSAVRAGYDYITTLNKRARSLGVEVRFSTRAMQIKTGSDNRIVGLVVQSESQSVEFEAPTVILAVTAATLPCAADMCLGWMLATRRRTIHISPVQIVLLATALRWERNWEPLWWIWIASW